MEIIMAMYNDKVIALEYDSSMGLVQGEPVNHVRP